MRRTLFSIAITLILFSVSPLAAQQQFQVETKAAPRQVGRETLKTETDRLSYSIGLDIGKNLRKNFKSQKLSLALDALLLGLKQGLSGSGEQAMTDGETLIVMRAFAQRLQVQQARKAQQSSQQNKALEDAFLAKNAKQPGVKTTKSGLQYKVAQSGKGKKPKATDSVTVHYRGRLLDGTEFDSSYARNQPATFPVNGVIPGWTEALQLMQEGAKYQLFIPAALGYGDRGAGKDIPPGATLLFEVELIKVN